jgi:hypothetical protein
VTNIILKKVRVKKKKNESSFQQMKRDIVITPIYYCIKEVWYCGH